MDQIFPGITALRQAEDWLRHNKFFVLPPEWKQDLVLSWLEQRFRDVAANVRITMQPVPGTEKTLGVAILEYVGLSDLGPSRETQRVMDRWNLQTRNGQW